MSNRLNAIAVTVKARALRLAADGRAGAVPMLRRSVPRAVSAAALLLALILIRHDLLGALSMDYATAFDNGLAIGYLFDLWAVLLVALSAQIGAAVTPVPARIWWIPLSLAMWSATAGNLLHYEFFHTRMDLWVVALHWHEAFVVGDSAAQLGFNFTIVAGLLLTVGGCVVAALEPRIVRNWLPPEEPKLPFWPARRRALVQLLLILVVFLCVHRVPRWFGVQQTTTLISGHIVRVWAHELTSTSVYAGAGTEWIDQVASATGEDAMEPAEQLARYRDLRFDDTGEEAEPLYRELESDPEETAALRRRLGLPEDGPIHVVMLYLESVRAFELYDETIGPQVFPNIRQIIAEKSISFRTAYSSAFTAGQTVRGQFSTNCSMIPNVTGAATYIAHHTIDVRCLAQLFGEAGYITTWMNSYRASFHAKKTFNTLHGTQRFFEGKDYEERGVTERFGGWGLADKPFLLESLKILEELDAEGKPVFTDMLTISAHHPYRVIEEGELPPELDAAAGERPYYHAYLSGLRYEDIAIGAFVDALFASPIADRTLVVMVADHGSAVVPHTPVTFEQRVEMRFRIPLALVSKNIPKPEVLEHPVHQVDEAPTVARIAGVSGPVTWVGRGLFREPGSPWVYAEDGRVSYRTRDTACYAFFNKPRYCVDVSETDPLYDGSQRQVDEDPVLTRFFERTVQAGFHAITLNRFKQR